MPARVLVCPVENGITRTMCEHSGSCWNPPRLTAELGLLPPIRSVPLRVMGVLSGDNVMNRKLHHLPLTKPLCVLDLETAGIEPAGLASEPRPIRDWLLGIRPRNGSAKARKRYDLPFRAAIPRLTSSRLFNSRRSASNRWAARSKEPVVLVSTRQ